MVTAEKVHEMIKARAEGLPEWLRETWIAGEIKGYERIDGLKAEGVSQQILDSIKDRCLSAHESFRVAADCIEKDISAYQFLCNYSDPRIAKDRFLEIREEAAKVYPQQYSSQQCRIERLVDDEIRNTATRARIDPVKSVMIELEMLVGCECWIENENSYDQYRYPITFCRGGESRLERTVDGDVSAEDLVAAHYKFGKNHLYIFEALLRIIEHLQANYGLDLTKESKVGVQ